MFQPFQQATSSISRKFGGTGLGLAISQKILALMGSHIEVESVSGQGSKFSFELTLPITEVKNASVPAFENQAPCLEGKRILLVEDTHFNVLYARQLLKGWCLQVDVAENGQMAVEKVYEGVYDLVLMDLQMPVMDGFSATEEIRQFNQKVPIIALTASASSSIKDKVLEVGMQDYVTKPFNPDIFLQKLTKYLS
ncbi:MAG: response regulator [Bacteroidota bacterium]|nr:response regulator [Bacteroidota bacterium]